MKYWVLPPNKLDYTGASPAVSSLPGSPSATQYIASNGTFDENGTLLFYVRDNNLYNGSGTYVDNYATGTGSYLGDEVAISPVPGSCRDFYIIYSLSDGMGALNLYYSKVSVSTGGTVTVVSKGNLIDNPGGGPSGIAVSQIQSGNVRYLYYKGPFILNRYTISSSGIGSMLNLRSNIDVGSFTKELELSNDGNTLAWADLNGNTIHTIGSNGLGHTTFSTSNTGTSMQVYGIEFSADRSKLYVSLHSMSGSSPFGGIYKIVLSTGVSTRLTSGDNYGFTHLELARNGYIYAVNSGSLGIINTSTDVVSSAGIAGTIYSDALNFGLNGYRLPDQIDGENYNYFFGIANLTLDGNINGSAISGTTPLATCSSGSITFNTTSTSVTDYRVRIYNSNSSGSQLAEVGTTPSWTTAALPSSINLKTLYSSYLNSHTGYYLVVLEVKNTCSQTSKTALLNIITVPSPTSNFTFTINTTQNITPSSTYPGNIACQAFTLVNGNNSSGFVTYYTIEIREVNCTTGVDLGRVGNVYSNTNVLNNDPSNINGLGIGPIVGQPFYFIANPNKCFKVIYTVGNPCGSQQSVGYFTNTDNTCRVGQFSSDVENNISTISPNPVKDKTMINFTLSENKPITLKIADMKGKEMTLIDNIYFNEGTHAQEIDMSNLPPGVYIYQLEADNLISGKIIKSE